MKKHIRFDWAIQRLLRQKANFGILEGFLSESLKEDVKISEILENESNKDREDSKFNKIDILVKNTADDLMLIEVQNERERDFFHRMNFGKPNKNCGWTICRSLKRRATRSTLIPSGLSRMCIKWPLRKEEFLQSRN